MLDRLFRILLRLISVRSAYRATKRGRLPQYAANRALWKLNRKLFRKVLFK